MVNASKGVDTPFQGDWQTVLGLILVVVVSVACSKSNALVHAALPPMHASISTHFKAAQLRILTQHK